MPRTPNPYWKAFGAKIKRLRQLADLSRVQVSEQVHVGGKPMSANYLRNIELGKAFPSRESLLRLLEVLGSDVPTLRAMLTEQEQTLLAGIDNPSIEPTPPNTLARQESYFNSLAAPASQARMRSTWSSPIAMQRSAPLPEQNLPSPKAKSAKRSRRSFGSSRGFSRRSADSEQEAHPEAAYFADTNNLEAASAFAADDLFSFAIEEGDGLAGSAVPQAQSLANAMPAPSHEPLESPLAPHPDKALDELGTIYSQLDNDSRLLLLSRARNLLKSKKES